MPVAVIIPVNINIPFVVYSVVVCRFVVWRNFVYIVLMASRNKETSLEIVLIRHGKPIAATNPSVNAVGYAKWVKQYQVSGVAASSQPDPSIKRRFSDHYVVSSNLNRAIESAQISLGITPKQQLKLLREMDIPRYRIPLTLKTRTWLHLSRVLWVLGIPGAFESHKVAKNRAKLAVEALIQLAKQHNNIVIFSHGYLNFYLRRYLSRAGWQVKEKSNQYWGVSRLVYHQ